MKNKNLLILTISQIFSFTAAPITVFLSGIIGSSLSEIKILATLPTALTVVGTAISSLIAALIMSKYGRKFGFLLGCFCNSFASILGAYAIIADNFLLLSTKKYVEAAPPHPNSPTDPRSCCFEGSRRVLHPRPHPYASSPLI